jgi:sortase A
MRRFTHILSIALITAGVVLIAEVAITLAYKEPLSSLYGSIKQAEAESQLNDLEAAFPTPADKQAVERVKNPKRRIGILAHRFAETAQTGKAIGRIEAPDMDGLNAIVVQGTDTSTLEKGPGHYPDTPFPGQGGTVGIAGHRTTYLAPFRHIDSMKAGDPIILKMPYATFEYRVEKTEVVDDSEVSVVKGVGYERLVLSACHPLYSADQRYIVFAKAVRESLAGGV